MKESRRQMKLRINKYEYFKRSNEKCCKTMELHSSLVDMTFNFDEFAIVKWQINQEPK